MLPVDDRPTQMADGALDNGTGTNTGTTPPSSGAGNWLRVLVGIPERGAWQLCHDPDLGLLPSGDIDPRSSLSVGTATPVLAAPLAYAEVSTYFQIPLLTGGSLSLHRLPATTPDPSPIADAGSWPAGWPDWPEDAGVLVEALPGDGGPLGGGETWPGDSGTAVQEFTPPTEPCDPEHRVALLAIEPGPEAPGQLDLTSPLQGPDRMATGLLSEAGGTYTLTASGLMVSKAGQETLYARELARAATLGLPPSEAARRATEQVELLTAALEPRLRLHGDLPGPQDGPAPIALTHLVADLEGSDSGGPAGMRACFRSGADGALQALPVTPMQATHPEGARFGVRTPLSLGPEAGAALQVNLHVQPTFDLEDRGCKSTALGPVTSGTLQRSLDNGDQRPFTLFAIGLDSVGQPCAGPMASRAIGCLIADDDALFSPTLLVLRDGPSP